VRVLFVSAEVAPFCRTGGLGDVADELPRALAQVDPRMEIAVVLPLHRKARRLLEARGETLGEGFAVDVPLAWGMASGRFRPLRGDEGVTHWFLDAPRMFDRDGLYGHEDDAFRYAFLSRAALEGATQMLGGPPDILHAHDWMTALAPIYLEARMRHRLPGCRSVFTVHNLAYQGVFPKDLLPLLDLDWGLFRVELLEFYDALNLMKGAIVACDALTTVSPRYAREIQTAQFGMKLDGHLRAHRRKLSGIVNGLDPAVWNPADDEAIAAAFDADDLRGRAACQQELRDAFGLGPGPIFGVVSRLTGQKGLDLVADLVPWMVRRGANLVVLGTGEPSLEYRFRELAHRFPNHVGAHIAFDSAAARKVLAGSDALLVPSRFEPCGLTQLQAMRYGSVPVVHAVGGLRDTVHDPGDAALARGEGTGFSFGHPTAYGLGWAMNRALQLHGTPGWAALQQACMRKDTSWGPSAKRYAELYRSLL